MSPWVLSVATLAVLAVPWVGFAIYSRGYRTGHKVGANDYERIKTFAEEGENGELVGLIPTHDGGRNLYSFYPGGGPDRGRRSTRRGGGDVDGR